jgi:DNA-binding transcriptional MerR regulator
MVIVKTAYNIKMASVHSGVSIYTIRAWEKRYQALTPKRKTSGHRLYTKIQVEKLTLLNQLSQAGHSISSIAHFNNAALKELIIESDLVQNNQELAKKKIVKNDDLNFLVSQSLTIILMALEHYNLDVISNELDKVKVQISPRDFALKIVIPLITELGLAVEKGEFTITHEHALSAIIKFHIGHLVYQPKKNLKKDHHMIICGIEGDYHEFGILISALLAIESGFTITYLGPHMPADSLADAVNSINPEYVVVGATSIVGTFGKNYLDKYIQKLDFKTDSICKIIIGSSLNFTPQRKVNHQIIHLKTLQEFDSYILNE